MFFAFLLLSSSSGIYFTQLFKPGITESLDALQQALNEGNITLETVDSLLSMNDYALFVYLCIILLPAFYFFCIALLYFLLRNATGVYLRNNIKSDNPQFIKLVHNYVYSKYRMRMFKKFMSLNWPFILFFSTGFTASLIVMLFFTKSVLAIASIALAGGMLTLTFFLPFYLCNMEVIYLDSASYFSDGLEYVTVRILNAMDMSNRMNEEQRKRYEDMLNKQKENNNQENNQKKKKKKGIFR